MFKVSRPYALLSGYYVVNCLRLFCCYHADGSDGRHVCTTYHGHTYHYQQLIGCYVDLRLFGVGGEHIAMVMVVVGHICTQQHYLIVIGIHCLRLFVLPWQHVTWLVKCC